MGFARWRVGSLLRGTVENNDLGRNRKKNSRMEICISSIYLYLSSYISYHQTNQENPLPFGDWKAMHPKTYHYFSTFYCFIVLSTMLMNIRMHIHFIFSTQSCITEQWKSISSNVLLDQFMVMQTSWSMLTQTQMTQSTTYLGYTVYHRLYSILMVQGHTE